VTIEPSPDPQVGRAAGGLVWWRSRGAWRIALVHRPRYDDWSLPKGKLEPGESWRDAALREVREETGCGVRVIGYAGLAAYLVAGRPKVVLYWNMEREGECAFQAGREIDGLEWLSRRAAIARLSHPAERELLRRNRPPR
jgi:8-oxo-dGTP diphosphatase